MQQLPQGKSKFRSRKLDYKKALTILAPEETAAIGDIDDEIYRAVPLVSTGVEKEEEEEHHLQAVISASMLATQTSSAHQQQSSASAGFPNSSNNGELVSVPEEKKAVYIPTPDASRLIPVEEYEQFYLPDYKLPNSLIRSSRTVEDCVVLKVAGGQMELVCQYCAGQEDLQFMRSCQVLWQQVSMDAFEAVINQLDQLTSDKMRETRSVESYAQQPDLDSFLLLNASLFQDAASDFKSVKLPAIYQYWKQCRELKKGRPVMPLIRLEECPWQNANGDYRASNEDYDPFVCFRKRNLKQTRKTRRTDAQSLQKLLRVRQDLKSARALTGMVLRREKIKAEMLNEELEYFESRARVAEYAQLLPLDPAVVEEARVARRKLKSQTQLSRNDQSARNATNAQTNEKSERKRKFIPVLKYEDPVEAVIRAELAKRLHTSTSRLSGLSRMERLAMLHPAAQYWQDDAKLTMANGSASSLICGRARVGRGGRVIIDRHSVCSGGWQRGGRWRFDNWDEIEDEMTAFSYDDPCRKAEFPTHSLLPKSQISLAQNFGVNFGNLEVRNQVLQCRMKLLGGEKSVLKDCVQTNGDGGQPLPSGLVDMQID